MKIIIGAGKTAQDGFLSTQESELSLLNRENFSRILGENKAECFLAEHVFEHLTYEEGLLAAKNCFDFLQPGGYLRAAVPDGNFRNEWFQNMVKIGGSGDPNHPAFTHKIVYDYKTFVKLFESVGFEVNLLEYCDEQGRFHYRYWNDADGHIGRSFRYDTRNSEEHLGMVSIIVDAVKPKIINNY